MKFQLLLATGATADLILRELAPSPFANEVDRTPEKCPKGWRPVKAKKCRHNGQKVECNDIPGCGKSGCGSDLRKKARTIEECAQMCYDTKGCGSFSFAKRGSDNDRDSACDMHRKRERPTHFWTGVVAKIPGAKYQTYCIHDSPFRKDRTPLKCPAGWKPVEEKKCKHRGKQVACNDIGGCGMSGCGSNLRKSAKTIEQCAQLCENTQGCAGFSFANKGSDNKVDSACDMHRAGEKPRTFWTGVVRRTRGARFQTFCFYDGPFAKQVEKKPLRCPKGWKPVEEKKCQFNGKPVRCNDIPWCGMSVCGSDLRKSAKTIEQCAKLCKETEGCAGFSFANKGSDNARDSACDMHRAGEQPTHFWTGVVAKTLGAKYQTFCIDEAPAPVCKVTNLRGEEIESDFELSDPAYGYQKNEQCRGGAKYFMPGNVNTFKKLAFWKKICSKNYPRCKAEDMIKTPQECAAAHTELSGHSEIQGTGIYRNVWEHGYKFGPPGCNMDSNGQGQKRQYHSYFTPEGINDNTLPKNSHGGLLNKEEFGAEGRGYFMMSLCKC